VVCGHDARIFPALRTKYASHHGHSHAHAYDDDSWLGTIRTAERSSLEIKDLLRKLHPSAGNHKDRIRRLNKFRNYVQPDVRFFAETLLAIIVLVVVWWSLSLLPI
jgi:hypothetical protein